ncbi:MAG: hypothetical protein ABH842_01770 [Candidatus Micrarchaeota archaeon]
MKIMNLMIMMLILGLAFAETAPLTVIAVNNGPAGYGTPSVSNVDVYMKDPSTGVILDSDTTTTAGAIVYPELDESFYITTAATGALGGKYGFLQELEGKGVPTFTISKNGSIYALCKVSTSECSYSSTPLLILYKLYDSENNGPTHGGKELCIDESLTDNGYTVTLDNIIKPATPIDKAELSFSPSVWDPTLNIDGTTHIYTGNDVNITITLYSLDSDCVEILYNVDIEEENSGEDSEYDCTSTDETNGAYNIYTKGTRTVNGVTATDYCSGDYLIETWCSGDVGYTTTVLCPSGYECSDGACIEETETISKYCKETDQGKDRYNAGTNYIYYSNGTLFASASDYCKDLSTVAEITCNGDQWDVSYETCPSGYGCSNGACIADGMTPNWQIDTLPVTFEVAVNNYPDSEDYSLTTNIDGWVNMYSVAVVNGQYKGTLLETKQATEDNGASFTVEYGEIVDFVGFKYQTNANAATSWTFSSPPYKHFGNTNALCQINFLDSTTIMESNGEASCASSLSTPYQDEDAGIPTLPEEYNYTYSITLQTGWNLISSPVMGSSSSRSEAVVTATTCDISQVYVHDQAYRSYVTSGYGVDVGDVVPVPNAMWVKTTEPCKITFTGSSKMEYTNGWAVSAGWVGFGGAYTSTSWSDFVGDCNVVSGPWKFNTTAWQWEKATAIRPGEGYFVKVADACTLGASSMPPSLPS